MEKEEKDIELRCEEVQEILTRPPHALVRWGITVFFTVLALFFIGGCFFKYPDVVSAEITVTTEHPPVWIVARGNGKIKEVYGKDREQVKVGKIIAIPSLSRDKEKAADYRQNYIELQAMVSGRKGNNVRYLSPMFDLNKPNESYSN